MHVLLGLLGLWARVISHACGWPTQRTRGQRLRPHTCVLQKLGTCGHASGCLIAHAASVVMFERVCVCDFTDSDVCCRRVQMRVLRKGVLL